MTTPMSIQYYLRRILALKASIDRLPQATIDRIANGCGPKGALIDLVDDDPLGADFGPGCESHDVGYHLGENDEDKTIADLLFLNMMVLSIIYGDSSGVVKALQLNIAMKYFAGVYFKGEDAFYADKGKPDN